MGIYTPGQASNMRRWTREAPGFIKIPISNKSTTLTQVAQDLQRAGGISYIYNCQKFTLSSWVIDSGKTGKKNLVLCDLEFIGKFVKITVIKLDGTFTLPGIKEVYQLYTFMVEFNGKVLNIFLRM